MSAPIPNRKKISLSVVAKIAPNTTVWDTDLKGFCCRRQSSRSITYLLKTRVEGRIRWLRIGTHGNPWTPDAARKEAMRLLVDPGTAREKKKTPPLLNEVIDEYLAVQGAKLKPSTLYVYECLIRKYLRPHFGNRPISDLSRPLIATQHAKWKDNHRSANYALGVLSSIMTFAEEQKYRDVGTNPVFKIQRFKERKRQKFLTQEELARLGAALNKAEQDQLANPYAIAAIRLLIFTGARLSEILTLEWAFIDLDRRTAFLPDSKTDDKPIVLNDAAVAVLSALPRLKDNPFVIVGHVHGRHMVNMQKPWKKIKELAELDGCRIHELRVIRTQAWGSTWEVPYRSSASLWAMLGRRQRIDTLI